MDEKKVEEEVSGSGSAEFGRQAVGDFKLDLPPADPSIGVEEIKRRHDLVTEPGPDTLLPPDLMARTR